MGGNSSLSGWTNGFIRAGRSGMQIGKVTGGKNGVQRSIWENLLSWNIIQATKLFLQII